MMVLPTKHNQRTCVTQEVKRYLKEKKKNNGYNNVKKKSFKDFASHGKANSYDGTPLMRMASQSRLDLKEKRGTLF